MFEILLCISGASHFRYLGKEDRKELLATPLLIEEYGQKQLKTETASAKSSASSSPMRDEPKTWKDAQPPNNSGIVLSYWTACKGKWAKDPCSVAEGPDQLPGKCIDKDGYLLCQQQGLKRVLVDACSGYGLRQSCKAMYKGVEISGICRFPFPDKICNSPALTSAEVMGCQDKAINAECDVPGPLNVIDATGVCVLTATGHKICKTQRRHSRLATACNGLPPGDAGKCRVYGYFPGQCEPQELYCQTGLPIKIPVEEEEEEEANSTNANSTNANSTNATSFMENETESLSVHTTSPEFAVAKTTYGDICDELRATEQTHAAVKEAFESAAENLTSSWLKLTGIDGDLRQMQLNFLRLKRQTLEDEHLVASCIGEFAVSSHMRDLLKDDIYRAAAWETKTESEIQDLLRGGTDWHTRRQIKEAKLVKTGLQTGLQELKKKFASMNGTEKALECKELSKRQNFSDTQAADAYARVTLGLVEEETARLDYEGLRDAAVRHLVLSNAWEQRLDYVRSEAQMSGGCGDNVSGVEETGAAGQGSRLANLLLPSRGTGTGGSRESDYDRGED